MAQYCVQYVIIIGYQSTSAADKADNICSKWLEWG